MKPSVAMLALLAGAVIIALFVLIRCVMARVRERTRTPPALRGASLVLSEKEFRSRSPFPLVARIDRAYRTGDVLSLVELKTRRHHKTYLSDAIEISAQKLAIEGATGAAVSSIGFVMTADPSTGSIASHPVRLMSPAKLIALKARRDGILAGLIVPRMAVSHALCRRCVFRFRCYPEESVD